MSSVLPICAGTLAAGDAVLIVERRETGWTGLEGSRFSGSS
jgi:hypothetical protein